MPSISIVVPIYNEEANVALLHQEIAAVCEKQHYDYEIILVDDGSSDRSLEVMKTLSPVRIIEFRRNFGQTAAMDAGIKAARKDIIVTMDGDRQNDPADIPNMINFLLEHDLDVVSGWRKNRKDKLLKKFTSRGANLLRGIIVKDHIHDSGCSLKVYRRECFDNVNLYGELHRFIPALLEIKGFRVGEMVVNHRPRTAGKTKYNWKRIFKGFVDMISLWFWNRYAVRPMHLLGGLGIGFFFLGMIFGVWTVVLFCLGNDISDTVQPLLTVFFLVIGALLFVFGLMTEMLSRLYFGMKVDTSYSIRKEYENGEEVQFK